MYEYTPPQNKKAALGAALACILTGSALCLPYNPKNSLFFSVLLCMGIVFLFAGAFVFFRFVMMSFTYRIEQNTDGTLDFCVICRIGKRLRTLCRVSLRDITGIYDSAQYKKLIKKSQFTSRYSYCPLTTKPYFLTLDNDDGSALIRFLSDKKLAYIISSNINNRKNNIF